MNYKYMPVLNVWGPPGSGKTHWFDHEYDGPPLIRVGFDILKSKEATIDIIERVKDWILVDDYESVINCAGISELKGNVYILSETKLTFDWVQGWMTIPRPERYELEARLKRPITETELNGNLHLLFNCSISKRDDFHDPFTYVRGIFDGTIPIDTNYSMSEHGHIFGIVHENYISTDPRVSDSLSFADILDSRIYSETSWDVAPFFHVSACLIPASIMKPTSIPALKTGSMWTKYANSCMKRTRLKKLSVHSDTIPMYITYANMGDPMTQFDSFDIDTLNQLSTEKIKPKIMNHLKKVRKESS